MATKQSPEIQVLCYPKTAISQRGPLFFSADNLGDLVFSNFGDDLGRLPEGATSVDAGAAWANQWQFQSLTDVTFVRFLKDGRVQFGATTKPDGSSSEERDIAGFVLSGREAIYDCQIGDNAGELTTDRTELNWTALSGTWKTVLPPESPRRTCIANVGADVLQQASSTGNLPANRSFGCPMVFAGHDPDGPLPAVRLMWGGDGDNSWSLLGRHGQAWAIEKKSGGAWSTVKVLTAAPAVNLHGGRLNAAFRRYAGRLVVTLNGAHYWVADHYMPSSGAGGNRRPQVREVVWPEGQLFLNAYNCKVRLGFSAWKYCEADGTPFDGSVVRRLNRTSYLAPGATLIVKLGGYRRYGANVTASASVITNAVEYTLALAANTDGIDTPFVDKVMVQKAPEPTAPSQSPLDIAAAVQTLTITKAKPPAECGDSLSIEISRTILESLSGYDASYIEDFCPIVVKTRWRYDDNTYSSWEVPFSGHIYGIGKGTKQIHHKTATIRGRDNLVRLQKPAGIIDSRFPPLDYWFALAGGAPLPGVAAPTVDFYAADGIKQIIRLVLGDTEADALNGNGEARRFLPGDQPPLLDVDHDGCGYFEFQTIAAALGGYTQPPPMVGGFYFPPPYRRDAWWWILDLAQKEKSIMCRRWVTDTATSAPPLCYGRPLNLISNRTARTVPDSDYSSGDVNKLIKSIHTETRPERQVNRVIASSLELRGGMEALAPALQYFETQLASTDDNAAINSWERTEWAEDHAAALPGAAQALAEAILQQLQGVTWTWPDAVDIVGDANWQFGDVVTFRMDGDGSDTALGLHDVSFRVEGVTQTINLAGVRDWKTTLACRPLTSIERAAL